MFKAMQFYARLAVLLVSLAVVLQIGKADDDSSPDDGPFGYVDNAVPLAGGKGKSGQKAPKAPGASGKKSGSSGKTPGSTGKKGGTGGGGSQVQGNNKGAKALRTEKGLHYFITYTPNLKDKAVEIAEFLKGKQIPVWIDKDGMKSIDETSKAIDDAKRIIPVYDATSPYTPAAYKFKHDIEYAASKRMNFIPVKMGRGATNGYVPLVLAGLLYSDFDKAKDTSFLQEFYQPPSVAAF